MCTLAEGKNRVGGSQCNRIQFHFCSLHVSQMYQHVCVQEHEVRVKIFKAFRVHFSVMSVGRRVSIRSQAYHRLLLPPSPPLITPPPFPRPALLIPALYQATSKFPSIYSFPLFSATTAGEDLVSKEARREGQLASC